MTGLARARRLRYVTEEILPFRSLLLALCLALGILCGYVCSGRWAAQTLDEVRRSFDGYLALSPQGVPGTETVVRTMECYFRAPVLAFLLGFASIGLAALPLLLAAQGFLVSFSMFSFAAALGRESFVILPRLFAIRLLFVLPCTFLLGTAAFEKSRALALLSFGGGKRARPVAYGAAYWYRFAVCCVCLFIGSVLELWLVPRLLAA